MKLELTVTAEQAQSIIDSQQREISALKGRLIRAHITSKYLARASAYVTPTRIELAIKELRSMIDNDQPDDAEDYGFQPRYDHSKIEDMILKMAELSERKDFHKDFGIRLPIISEMYQIINRSAWDDDTDSLESKVIMLQGYLHKDGEPETPDFFSSDGVWF